jgi:hypothetical protein
VAPIEYCLRLIFYGSHFSPLHQHKRDPDSSFSYLADVTITGDKAANLIPSLALMAFSSDGSFIVYVPHLLRHKTSVYAISSSASCIIKLLDLYASALDAPCGRQNFPLLSKYSHTYICIYMQNEFASDLIR